VRSNINGKEYLVRNLEDKQEAADLMARISQKLEKLVDIISKSNTDEMYEKYISQDIQKELYINIEAGTQSSEQEDKEIMQKIKKLFNRDLKRLVDNFNSDNFSENTPDSKYTSYSVNKGEKIVFCIRDKNENETLVNENIMMFVSIHELAHLMTKSVGHGPEFWTNFKILLKIAIDNNLYQYIDFNRKPEPYCGTKISDTPLKI
jgi:predicted metal-dependent hydrolase